MTVIREDSVRIPKRRFLEVVRRFKSARVLVVGDFILDQFIWGRVNRISPEAPVPVVQVDRESFMPGGALNVAHNILTLGGQVYPSGVVGRDLFGRMLVKVMKNHHVDTGGVVYDAGRPTTQKTRIIAHSQQVVRFDREKAGEVSPKDYARLLKFLRSKIRAVDGIILEDYGKGVVTPALIREAVKLARAHRKFILVDPKEKNFPYYKGVTAITPNRKEAYGGLGHAGEADGLPLEKVGHQLIQKLHCRMVLITLGEEGMALFEKGKKEVRIPTAAREVFDVSGAGDTVIAVFALCLAVGANAREAAYISNLGAGIVVGKLGTATISPDELLAAFPGNGA
jgi:D-beta-D-heptose 7-phosphate kinase/D-beta-D-heptose 1-phosphate adenosyltransferase